MKPEPKGCLIVLISYVFEQHFILIAVPRLTGLPAYEANAAGQAIERLRAARLIILIQGQNLDRF